MEHRRVLIGSATGICDQCGAEFTPYHNRKNVRFCGKQCERAWWKAHRQEHHAIGLHEFVCRHCGKTYRTEYKNRHDFCSQECYWADCHGRGEEREQRRKNKVLESRVGRYCVIYPGYCKYCGKPFVSRAKTRKFCSKGCVTADSLGGWWKKPLGERSQVLLGKCDHCGKQFTYRKQNHEHRYCSKKCTERANEERDPERYAGIRARSNLKRRARKMGNGPFEDITPLDVFKRDGWRCGICGSKVNPKLKFPHPKSPTVDHIVALAVGGPHTWANVQCAHMSCNSVKRELPGGQLRLALVLT